MRVHVYIRIRDRMLFTHAYAGNWMSFTPFAYGGNVVRKRYQLCFAYNEPPTWLTNWYAAVDVVVLADLGDQPIVTSFAITNAAGVQQVPTLSTYGNEFVDFFISGNPTKLGTNPTGNYSNCGSNPALAPVGCTTYQSTCGFGVNASGVPLVSAAQQFIRCATRPGVGNSHVWTLTWQNMIIAHSVPLVTSYAYPVIYNLTTNNALSTAGGTIVTINGANFGPYAAINDTTQVQFGANYEYTCVPVAALAGQDVQVTMRCITSVGAGALLPFRMYAGNQLLLSSSVPNQPTFSYAPPTVTWISVDVNGNEPIGSGAVNLGRLPTAGNIPIYIAGTNFGPATGYGNLPIPLSVTYGPSAAANSYSMVCNRGNGALAHTRLSCTLAPGVGAANRVLVTVAGTPAVVSTNGSVSARAGLTYIPPNVTGVSGVGAAGGATTGGSQLIVYALGTGPIGPLPTSSVVFGTAAPFKYAAVQCSVLVPHTGTVPGTISCLTPPGTGGGMSVQLMIGGQYSSIFTPSPAISYGAPVITGFSRASITDSVTGFSTGGNESVFINGLNFGPAGGTTNIVATYTSLARQVGGGNGTGGPGFGAAPGTLNLVMTASSCSVTQAHVQLLCTTVPGAGTNLQWFIQIDGMLSTSPTTGYGPPVITSIIDQATGAAVAQPMNPNMPYTLLLQGSNFGSRAFPVRLSGFGPNATNVMTDLVLSVTYGPSGTEYTPISIDHRDDNNIVVTLGPSTGSRMFFQINVAGQTIAQPTAFISYSAPVITSVFPNHGPLSNPVTSATQITIAVLNPPLFDSQTNVFVQIGAQSVWASVVPTLPGTYADLLNVANPDGSVPIPFNLPVSWGGQGLGVRIISQTLSGSEILAASDVNASTLFWYDAPNVTAAYSQPAVFSASNPCPWAAGSNPRWSCDGTRGTLYQIVLVGYNFGANPATFGSPLPFVPHLDVMVSSAGGGSTPTPAPSLSPSANSSSSSSPAPVASPSPTATPAPGTWVEASWVSAGGGAPSDPATVFFWSDSRIVAYTYAPIGQLSVRLTNADWSGTQQASSSPAYPYTQDAPIVSDLSGGFANVSTNGGAAASPLSLTVSNLNAGSDYVTISVGPNACPLVTGPSGGALGADAASQQAIITAAGTNPVRYYCVVPPGQGSSNLVVVTRYSNGRAISASSGTVNYAPPSSTAFAVLHYNPSPYVPGAPGWVTFPLTDPQNPPYVMMPTNGSLIQVSGYNLGTDPVLTISAGGFRLVLGGTTVRPGTSWPCSTTTATLGTCWTFVVPAGQGSGANFAPATGFVVALTAGDQVSNTSAFFVYNYPVITGYSVSGSGAVPTMGFQPGGGPITLTFNGYDFGAPIAAFGQTNLSSAVSLYFYRPVDESGTIGTATPTTAITCGSPTRLSHWQLQCTLPEGSGKALTLRLGVGFDEWWYGESTPGFSYDPPVVTELYSVTQAVTLPATACISTSTEYYDTNFNVTLTNTTLSCPPAPPNLMSLAITVNPARLARAVPFLVPGSASNAWTAVNGDITSNGSDGSPIGSFTTPLTASGVDVVPLPSGAPQYLSFVTLYGTNFGAGGLPRLHCPALSWSSRTVVSAPLCNGLEDFLGEGEVDGRMLAAGGRVISWSHTQITFVVPPGMGRKDIDVAVRGNTLMGFNPGDATRPRLLYNPPVLQSGTPQLMDTTGGTRITLTGYGFGPVPFAPASAAMALASSTPMRVPLALAPSLPTYAIRIDFGDIPPGGGYKQVRRRTCEREYVVVCMRWLQAGGWGTCANEHA